MELDHIAIVCADLDEGVRAVETALDLPLGPHGKHALFATHNRLLSLGPGQYLEVIAPDPEASPPMRPRWFGLDDAPLVPRMGNWIVRVDDIDRGLSEAPIDLGAAEDLERNGLTWKIAVPPDGSLPMSGGWPTLIEWTSGPHPSVTLEDVGVRLVALEIRHPQANWLAEHLVDAVRGVDLSIEPGKEPGLTAILETPSGLVHL